MTERKFKVIQEDGESYLIFGTQKILLSYYDIIDLEEDLRIAHNHWIIQAIRDNDIPENSIDDQNEDDIIG